MQSTFEGAIGIDLGTTYSCVAVFLHNAVDVIPNDQGNRTTPSRIAFHNNQLLVGDAAFNLSARGATGVVYDAKRLIGRKFSDKEVKEDVKNWPFEVVATENDRVGVKVEHKGETLVLEPQQISAHLLTYLKQCAERHLGKKVVRAVITVPAYFNDAQRQATRDAGAIAGLDVIRIINEPTAAALCYGLGVGTALGAQGTDAAKNVLVFDFGGGTFDVSIITIDCGAFEVRSTAGDTHLGGQDVDQAVLKWFLDDCKKRHQADFTSNTKVKAKLRSIAEKVKRALSHSTQEEVACDGILPGGDDYVVTLSRAKFDEINAGVYKRCLDMVDRALKDASMKTTDIHEIVMVGGSSRIPKVRELVSQHFQNRQLCTGVNPDEAIAVGAAIQASILSTDAAQQSDKTAGVVLMDVVSLSLGLDVDEGHFDILIPRNTTIPYTKTKEFSTVYNNQTEVEVEVFEGERPLTKHNHKLGSFTLEGITKGKAGTPSIVVSLSVDANGILTVAATETKSSKTKNLVVDCKERLSTDAVNKMIEEAAKMRSSDKTEASFLLRTKEVESALVSLDEKRRKILAMSISSRKLEKLTSRCGFIEKALAWLQGPAREEEDDVLDGKVEKIWRLIQKADVTAKKLLLVAGKKSGKKRSRDDDDDDDEEAGDAGGDSEDDGSDDENDDDGDSD
ncbi:heat shock protein 70, putative [Bodo saltans]|uniref:Heat shock protein 70, putative n=1 Tax=Bodo saltans TaxID=75058 RepID=A0A0S4J8H0_BODSA|nr:heat shock protein 70, putative [Bodo saltans]|eukprot:CUG86635.1 heat shock protein 70, putative [Bodo saltans]